MYINFQQNRVCRSVKTMHTNLFARNRKLHKFATTNSNFEKIDYLSRHEIFPEFSGIPEFCRPQRSISWKSQIRLNIYGGGGTILCMPADRQQCWDGTTYIPHYQPILNTESSQVAGVCTTSTCSIA